MHFSHLKFERISNVVLYIEFSTVSNTCICINMHIHTRMDKIPQILISINFPLKILLSENAFGSVVDFIHAEKFIPVSLQISLCCSFLISAPNQTH